MSGYSRIFSGFFLLAVASSSYAVSVTTRDYPNDCSSHNNDPRCMVVSYPTYPNGEDEGTRYTKAICSPGEYVSWSGDYSVTRPNLYDVQTAVNFMCSDEPPLPECDENHHPDESGVCIPDPEICWDDIVTGRVECEWIDPDENPEGCVTADGVTLCLNEDIPDCLLVNGELRCDSPEQICGVKNQTYQCVSPQEEGCGFFNGEKVCVTPDGDYVPPESPDHPDNGGNLDGDETNDVKDSRSPEQGGDPSNQPGYFPPTTDDNRASEQTSQDQLNELRGISETLSKIEENTSPGEMPTETEGQIVSDIDNKGDTALDGVGDLVDSISEGDGPFSADDAGGIGDTITGVLQPQACTDLSFVTSKGGFVISCQDGQKIRDMLGYVLYIFTLLALFNVVTTSPKGA